MQTLKSRDETSHFDISIGTKDVIYSLFELHHPFLLGFYKTTDLPTKNPKPPLVHQTENASVTVTQCKGVHGTTTISSSWGAIQVRRLVKIWADMVRNTTSRSL